MSDIGGAIIGGVSNLLGSAISAGANAMISKRQRRWSEGQINKQYDRDIKQRDYMNWYNSPDQQMQRFEEAGLNPNLIYGKGTPGVQSTPVKSSVPEGKFPTVGKINLDPLTELNKYQNFRKLKAQTDLTSEVANGQFIKNQLARGTLQTKINQAVHDLALTIANTKNAMARTQLQLELKELNRLKVKIDSVKADWYQSGFNENDSSILRMGYQGLQNTFGTGWMKDVKDSIKNYWNSPKN